MNIIHMIGKAWEQGYHQYVHVNRNVAVNYRVYLYLQMMDNPQEVAEREPSRVAARFATFEGQDTTQFFVLLTNLY